jgi:predicted glutamine amidotransferase
MCRILILNNKKSCDIQKDLADFALMCKNSKKWQGDGWGVARLKRKNWDIYKSQKPIWKDQKVFDNLKKSKLFIVHARGSSFKRHRGNVAHNQPFYKEKVVFAFNGFINGVRLSYKVPGRIGSEKVFNLLLRFYRKEKNLKKAFQKTKKTIIENSKIIEAINIGMSDGKKIYALTYYDNDPDYFNLRYCKKENKQIICSEVIGEYNFKQLKKGRIYEFESI